MWATQKILSGSLHPSLLSDFGLTSYLAGQVQNLVAEPANVAVQRLQQTLNVATIAQQSVATALLARQRTDRPSAPPHPHLLSAFHLTPKL